MMHVSRLSLENFRSYREARLEAGPGMVVVTGDNGAGKTNLLEALSLLAPGRGLRSAALREMARDDGDGGFAVAARLPGLDIGIGTLPASPDRRLVRVNGLAAAANSLPEHVSFLWLTPAMDRLFAEPASARRRFLDRLVLALDPAHAAHSARYEAAMRARNKLLAGEGMPDAAWMAAVEARMAEHGAQIVEARSAAVRALQEAISAEPESPFPRAVLALEGGEEKDLAERLAAGRLRDAESGRTLAGPHRTDLVVTHEGKARPASASSTGEQKALLVGIVLAHARLVEDKSGRRPILLLDEIAAHLDARRRGVLLARLAADGGQVWMTGTDRHLFDSAPGTPTFLSVEDGRVRAA